MQHICVYWLADAFICGKKFPLDESHLVMLAVDSIFVSNKKKIFFFRFYFPHKNRIEFNQHRFSFTSIYNSPVRLCWLCIVCIYMKTKKTAKIFIAKAFIIKRKAKSSLLIMKCVYMRRCRHTWQMTALLTQLYWTLQMSGNYFEVLRIPDEDLVLKIIFLSDFFLQAVDCEWSRPDFTQYLWTF